MKKLAFVSNIIKEIFILMLLIFVFINNEQLYFKLFILFFISLIICSIVKNVCELLNKQKIANVFNKAFVTILLLL